MTSIGQLFVKSQSLFVSNQQTFNILSQGLSADGVSEKRNRLNRAIFTLKKKEEEVLKMLGCRSIEELRKRVDAFNTKTNFVMAGQELAERIIFPYVNNTDRENKLLREAMNEVFQILLAKFRTSDDYENYIFNATLETTEAQQEYLAFVNWMANFLNKKLSLSKGEKFGFFKNVEVVNTGSLEKADVGKGTIRQQELWKQALYDVAKSGEYEGISMERLKELEQSVTFELTPNKKGINLRALTKGKKASQVKRFTKEDEKNMQLLKKELLAMTGSMYKHYERAFDTVYNKNKKAFYVGVAEKQLTGVFGEIQALAYISYLLGCGTGGTISWEQVQWTAEKYGSEHNPHADIILDNAAGLGIQVKNSIAKTPFSEVHFTTQNFNNFFESLRRIAGGDFVEKYREGIQQAYINQFFNQTIAYNNSTDSWEYGENSDFNSLRSGVENRAAMATELLSMFTAELMYMSVEKSIDKAPTTANVLYFLVGQGVLLASEIMEKEAKKKEIVLTDNGVQSIPLNRFSVSPIVDKKSSYTVKDFYNENKEDMKNRDSNIPSQFPTDAATMALINKIKLQTAYDFSV